MLVADEAVEIRALRRQARALARSLECSTCHPARCDATCGSKDYRGRSVKHDRASLTRTSVTSMSE
jgi:hypothetical protein